MVRVLLVLVLLMLTLSPVVAQPREEKVRNDKAKFEKQSLWIYNDFAEARKQATATKKPILAVLRCLPCEECVKLDDDLIDADAAIQPLLEKFVCVRLISTNGLDLSLFQFDTDQSFAVFFFEGDGTTLGRFGTRSHRKNWVGDVSVEGLAEAMRGALELHADFPRNAASLKAKTGPKPEFARPELFPTHKTKYQEKIDYTNKVVPTCIHCHQIGDAARELRLSRKESLPEQLLFPYPHPTRTLGLTLDPKKKASVLAVAPDSIAAKAGLKPGDAITTLAGQPLLSIADMQWVLHHTPGEDQTILAMISRDGINLTLSLTLPAGWKTQDDISWRSSSWGLRRHGLGGIFSLEMTAEEKALHKLKPDQPGLLIQHVGQFAPHDIAHKAGFKKGDIITEFHGHNFIRETDLLIYGVTKAPKREAIPVKLLRAGQVKTINLTLP
ncbi:MAG: Trx7/PDZ domain-containing (seleno)protein [Fimbriiglobus sp.]